MKVIIDGLLKPKPSGSEIKKLIEEPLKPNACGTEMKDGVDEPLGGNPCLSPKVLKAGCYVIGGFFTASSIIMILVSLAMLAVAVGVLVAGGLFLSNGRVASWSEGVEFIYLNRDFEWKFYCGFNEVEQQFTQVSADDVIRRVSPFLQDGIIYAASFLAFGIGSIIFSSILIHGTTTANYKLLKAFLIYLGILIILTIVAIVYTLWISHCLNNLGLIPLAISFACFFWVLDYFKHLTNSEMKPVTPQID